MARAVATVLVIAAAIAVLYAWFAWASRCDDSCVGLRGTSPPAGAPWGDYQSSWQWTGQLVLAGTGFVLTAAARLAIARGRGRIATGLFAIAAVVFVCWVAMLPQGRFSIL